ncbi:MAG: DUF115 domain-containing protein [Spirochaetales bacterium]|jgi:hypothetical protein|nr:DUF115 domain-containing protein [Spirochaetales bacterium]
MRGLRITDSPEGPVLYSDDKPLYHPQHPKSRARETARRENIRGQTLVLVPSPLFGYGLDELLENLPAESRLLCVEHDEELMAASLSHFPRELLHDPRLAFVRAADVRQACAFATQRFGAHLFRRVAVVSLTRGYSLFPDFYRELSAGLLDMIQTYWRNRMTALHMGRLWMGNLFTNLTALPACRPLTDLRFSRPLVLAGAGESLERHLDFLSSRRAEFSLVCVDTALPVLRRAGLTPDLIIIAEAQFANMYDFAGLGKDGWNIPIAADLSSYPGIFRRFTGARYVFLSRFTELAWFDLDDVKTILPPFIPPLGSVGVMALYIAALAAAENCPVFLAGMDLRYTAGKPHAKGSPTHTLLLAGENRLSYPRYLASWYARPREKAPLAAGGTAVVDAVLASYRNALREIAQSRKNVYSLEGEGLEVGAPLVSHEEVQKHFTRAGNKEEASLCASGSDAQRTAAGQTVWTADAINIFCNTQISQLAKIASSVRKVSDEDIKKCDYLLLDSPENPPYPLEDAGFIRHVCERAAWYAQRLSRALCAGIPPQQ